MILNFSNLLFKSRNNKEKDKNVELKKYKKLKSKETISMKSLNRKLMKEKTKRWKKLKSTHLSSRKQKQKNNYKSLNKSKLMKFIKNTKKIFHFFRLSKNNKIKMKSKEQSS